ncbi:MAG: AAA family ATPase [Janthinobacterium lividum]
MYIETVDIKNIKSIKHFRMNFPKRPGWHVLIGDNGTGKSTLLRAIALALIGPDEFKSARIILTDWLRQGAKAAEISLTLDKDALLDGHAGKQRPVIGSVNATVCINYAEVFSEDEIPQLQAVGKHGPRSAFSHNWSNARGWFSAGFGPFRRFTGGNKDWESTYQFAPKAGAHLSLFGEDVALTESLRWLEKLYSQSIDSLQSEKVRGDAEKILTAIKSLINSPDFLPDGIRLEKIFTGGILFTGRFGDTLPISQLSDGFRSVLSLTFELIRQLGRVYGDVAVAASLMLDNSVAYPGVVLIDEIDAHLHPSWQTQIGQWFTSHFPAIQFIVTTHSPLICRRAYDSSIFRLTVPNSGNISGEITGTERDRLVYGNILEAYDTQLFGDVPGHNDKGQELLNRLTELNARYAFGKTSKEEEVEMWRLRKIFTTDVALDL